MPVYESPLWRPREPENLKKLDEVLSDFDPIAEPTEFVSALAVFVGDIIMSNDSIYTATEAEKFGGNCYAVAEALGSLLSQSGFITYIKLGQKHASNVVDISGRAYCIDPRFGSGTRRPSFMIEAYDRFLEYCSNTASGVGAAYFWYGEEDEMESATIADDLDELWLPKDDFAGVHVLMSARPGIETLHALGGLSSYKVHDLDLYTAALANLHSLIPTFTSHAQYGS